VRLVGQILQDADHFPYFSDEGSKDDNPNKRGQQKGEHRLLLFNDQDQKGCDEAQTHHLDNFQADRLPSCAKQKHIFNRLKQILHQRRHHEQNHNKTKQRHPMGKIFLSHLF
jgi:hypothetical protein